MTDFFEPEDFLKDHITKEYAAKVANAKLGEQKVVYWNPYSETPPTFSYIKEPKDTTQAYLVGITEIEPCKHEPENAARTHFFDALAPVECSKCGVRLKPTGWTVV